VCRQDDPNHTVEPVVEFLRSIGDDTDSSPFRV